MNTWDHVETCTRLWDKSKQVRNANKGCLTTTRYRGWRKQYKITGIENSSENRKYKSKDEFHIHKHKYNGISISIWASEVALNVEHMHKHTHTHTTQSYGDDVSIVSYCVCLYASKTRTFIRNFLNAYFGGVEQCLKLTCTMQNIHRCVAMEKYSRQKTQRPGKCNMCNIGKFACWQMPQNKIETSLLEVVDSSDYGFISRVPSMALGSRKSCPL